MVQDRRRLRANAILAAVVAIGALACGRSENVGWSEGEQPEGVRRRMAAIQSDSMLQTDAAEQPSEGEAVRREYNRLGQSLRELQMRVMAEADLTDRWNELISDVDEAIAVSSPFHVDVLERRSEIEELYIESQKPGGQGLSQEEVTQLAQYYRNIEIELARVRNIELRRPEFAVRYLSLQAELFARMRELEPRRAADINRLEQLEQIMLLSQGPPPEGPGMGVLPTPPGM